MAKRLAEARRSLFCLRITASTPRVPVSTTGDMPAENLTIWYNTRCDAGIDWQHTKLLALIFAGRMEFGDLNGGLTRWRVMALQVDYVGRHMHQSILLSRHSKGYA